MGLAAQVFNSYYCHDAELFHVDKVEGSDSGVATTDGEGELDPLLQNHVMIRTFICKSLSEYSQCRYIWYLTVPDDGIPGIPRFEPVVSKLRANLI